MLVILDHGSKTNERDPSILYNLSREFAHELHYFEVGHQHFLLSGPVGAFVGDFDRYTEDKSISGSFDVEWMDQVFFLAGSAILWASLIVFCHSFSLVWQLDSQSHRAIAIAQRIGGCVHEVVLFVYCLS
jgi:hypothetical protein